MENNNTVQNVVHGFKVFNPDWTCDPTGHNPKQYSCPGMFEEYVDLSVCNEGMHFCEKASDCFNYYKFDSKNKVAEVIAHGEVRTDGVKSCTNKLEIVREIPWQELLAIVNAGKDCTGLCNSGNCNSGNCNSGDWNSGNCNSGDWNSGDWNSGDYNSGDYNSGDWNSGNCNSGNCNSGDWNSGNCNSGDWNSGDWNSTSFSSGCFNTEESEIMMFNKPSGWTYRDWLNSEARFLLNQIPKNVVEWIYESNMTNEEKEAHPTYKTTGGYLKELDESDCAQMWWNGLLEHQRNIIKALPNFDVEIFKQCTGITIESEEQENGTNETSEGQIHRRS